MIVTQFYVSLLFSGILGFIAYGLFASSLLQGTCFPSSKHMEHPMSPWQTLLTLASPATNLDAAKAVIWAFIAGFSERFVPNAIDALTKGSPLPGKTPGIRAGQTGALPPWMQTGLPGIRMKYTGAACCSRIAITDKHLTPASTQQYDAMTKTLIPDIDAGLNESISSCRPWSWIRMLYVL